MVKFKAYRVHTIDGRAISRFERLSLEDLDPGPVVIEVAYSAINYKDAMAARGLGKTVRTDRPCVTGIDLAGTVVASEDPRFKKGDPVIATNYELGVEHDGGYAEYARVPADWIVPLPDGLTLYEAICLGTSGLTAALTVDRLEKAGLAPKAGAIAVTGATGSVGSLAIDLFAKRGYRVTAITGKQEQAPFLKTIGAQSIMSREEFIADRSALPPPLFAGALDNVGGIYLDRLLARMQPAGKVAVAGMAAGMALATTVLPFVLRAVDILGINVARRLQMAERKNLWGRLATDLKPMHLYEIARPIAFDRLDTTMDRFLDVTTVGRVVVEIGCRAPR